MREISKENMLWEFLVNNYEVKALRKTLRSMTHQEITQFLTECDKLGSDIINDRNPMFEKRAVSVIIAVRKIAVSIGRKKIMEAMK